MSKRRARVRKVVTIDKGVAKSRCVRKGSKMKYDPQLQEVLDVEGQPALEQVAVKWFHGLVRKKR